MSTNPPRPFPESYWVIPGQFLAGEHPGRFNLHETRSRVDALLRGGIDTFIDLKSPGELPSYEEILQEQAHHRGRTAKLLNFPIEDRGLPSHLELTAILDTLDETLANGQKVYLHCWAGVGRTGTVVGCYLVRHGRTGQQALLQIAEWWQDVPQNRFFPRAPETDEQVRFILDWKE